MASLQLVALSSVDRKCHHREVLYRGLKPYMHTFMVVENIQNSKVPYREKNVTPTPILTHRHFMNCIPGQLLRTGQVGHTACDSGHRETVSKVS
jgi:hypothetical protein